MTLARNSVCYDGYKRPKVRKVPEVNVKGRQSKGSRQWPLNDLKLSFKAHLVLSPEWIWSNDWYFVMGGEEASKTVEIPFTKRMRKATAKIHNVSDTLVNVVSAMCITIKSHRISFMFKFVTCKLKLKFEVTIIIITTTTTYVKCVQCFIHLYFIETWADYFWRNGVEARNFDVQLRL